MTRLEIVVDELVVRGLSPSAARTAADALEARLTELAGTAGDDAVAARAEAFRRLPPIDLDSAEPSALGGAVADAVWNTVSRVGAR